MKSFIPFLLVSLPLISAHFTLDFPTTRGFDEDLEPQFCGGFNSSATRSLFPLGSAPISINSHHPTADIGIQISFQSNPTSFNQFNQTSTGKGYGDLMNFGTINGQGEWCFHVDVSSLGVAGVGNGTLATIQVIFNGGDGALLQCADVILSSTYTASNQTCMNVTSSAAVTNSSSSSVTTSAIVPAKSTSLNITATTASGVVPAAAATSAKSASVRGVEVGLGGLIFAGLVGLFV